MFKSEAVVGEFVLQGLGESVLEIRLINVTLTHRGHSGRNLRGDYSYYLQFRDRRARDDLVTEHMRYNPGYHKQIFGQCDCRRCKKK